MSNSNYNKIGYIEIPTDNIDETKKFYSNMFGWEYEKSEKDREGEEGENYWLIKNAGVKGAITSKRENNQTPTFYIMVESIDDFIAKSQKQGAKVVVNKKEIPEGFYATIQDQQQNTFGLWQSKNNN
ncbi:MAG TPA: VOC family protein [Nitrososphaeraceae archaeon]|nr:VOC family protein [Nitrososphaeraceae archaeon]